MRTLLLIRHSLAEDAALTDHARALTSRGEARAIALGRRLDELDLRPEYAFVSDATRTQQTWKRCAEQFAVAPEFELASGLYQAGPNEALEFVQYGRPQAQTLAIVGHNPTMAALAALLAGEASDPRAVDSVTRTFPPASVGVIEVPGEWENLGWAEGVLRSHILVD